MFNRRNKMMFGVRLFAISVVVMVGFAAASANAQVDYALMVQQTPADGGTVSPDIGVHSIAANGAVTVTATPRQGYQFVYWLGDVSDPTANSTVVSINAPKIVVAVFQRSEYELPIETPAVAEGAGGGGGGLVPNSQHVGGGGGISPATGASSYKGPTYVIKQPDNSQPDDSITETNDDYQVPSTPEPATVMLLGIGSLLALKRKK
jgi:hypothetical protein